MPKKSKPRKDIEEGEKFKYRKWPFIIWYTCMGELDSMEVFHFGPRLARQTFQKKYPAYKVVKTEPGTLKVPKKKELIELPDFEIDTSIIDQIINN